MDKILSWFTRGKLFAVSLISSVGFFILIPREVLSKVCPTNHSICINSFNYLLLVLMFGVIMLLFSIVMFSLKQQIFESWKKTLFIYLFIYLFIMIITPWYAGDGFFHIQKDLILLSTLVIYTIFSIIFIIYKSLQKKDSKQ